MNTYRKINEIKCTEEENIYTSKLYLNSISLLLSSILIPLSPFLFVPSTFILLFRVSRLIARETTINPRVMDNRTVRSQLSPLLSPLSPPSFFSAFSSVFNSSTSSLLIRRRISMAAVHRDLTSQRRALKNVTNRRREGQKAAARPRGKPGVSTANGARLISWAIHLNDRAKASSSFHARVYIQRRWVRVSATPYTRTHIWPGSRRPVLATCQLLKNTMPLFVTVDTGTETIRPAAAPGLVAIYRNIARATVKEETPR